MAIEYLEPTTSARIRRLAGLGLCALVLVIGEFIVFPYVRSMSPCDAHSWNKGILLGEAVFFVAVALWLVHRMWKTIRFRQFPPPGTDVFFRTRIYRGPWLAAVIGTQVAVLFALGWFAVELVPPMAKVVHSVSIHCAA